jgi:hypothetical protein
MRVLALPVDDSVAENYNSAEPQEKTVINTAVNLLLTNFLKKKQDADLFNIMDELGEEAAKNGLTVEKLGELMEWDDETMKNLFGDSHPVHAK